MIKLLGQYEKQAQKLFKQLQLHLLPTACLQSPAIVMIITHTYSLEG